MSEEMESLRSFDDEDSTKSDKVKSKIDCAIEALLNESRLRVTTLLTEHRDELDLLATSLLLKKTLFADDIRTLIEDHLSNGKTKTANESVPEKNGSENAFDLLDAKNNVK